MTGPVAQPVDLSTIDLDYVESRISRADDPLGCWVWTGASSSNGYGYVSRGRSRTKVLAHRVVYTVHRGQIPDGLPLDHLCRRSICVNPDHLEPVTVAENNRRGFGASGIHGRQTHCINNHEFTVENTLHTRTGARQCRACTRIRESNRGNGWARQRAANERTSA